MEYYSAMKRNGSLFHAMTRLSLRCILLGAGRQLPANGSVLQGVQKRNRPLAARDEGWREGPTGKKSRRRELTAVMEMF